MMTGNKDKDNSGLMKDNKGLIAESTADCEVLVYTGDENGRKVCHHKKRTLLRTKHQLNDTLHTSMLNRSDFVSSRESNPSQPTQVES